MSESILQKKIMLALSAKGVFIFRNNCGYAKTDNGQFIKYGVGNPGGSDLIGLTPTEITQEMVGRKIGVFTAIEVKTEKGRVTPEQKRFIDAVRKAGGVAAVVRSVDEAIDLL